MGKDINDLSRQNVQTIVNKSINLLKLTYRVNKFKQSFASIGDSVVLQFLKTVIKKEELSKNVLNNEDLKKFG